MTDETRDRTSSPEVEVEPQDAETAAEITAPFVLTRRQVLAAGAAGGIVAGAAALPRVLARNAPSSQAPAEALGPDGHTAPAHQHAVQPAPNAEGGGFTYFVPWQAAIIQAAAARLIPTDELGPGATEAGVVYFIDRQLAAKTPFVGFRGPRYHLGPFQSGEPTQGDQSSLPLRDRFRLGIFGMEAYAQHLYSRGFAQLEPEQQDRILRDMEQGIPETFDGASLQSAPATPAPAGTEAIEQAGQTGIGARAFFDLLLAFTLAGFFADPVQGGNRDMVGWKLIGFPGAHASYADQILNYGEPFQGDFISLSQYQQQVSGGA